MSSWMPSPASLSQTTPPSPPPPSCLLPMWLELCFEVCWTLGADAGSWRLPSEPPFCPRSFSTHRSFIGGTRPIWVATRGMRQRVCIPRQHLWWPSLEENTVEFIVFPSFRLTTLSPSAAVASVPHLPGLCYLDCPPSKVDTVLLTIIDHWIVFLCVNSQVFFWSVEEGML